MCLVESFETPSFIDVLLRFRFSSDHFRYFVIMSFVIYHLGVHQEKYCLLQFSIYKIKINEYEIIISIWRKGGKIILFFKFFKASRASLLIRCRLRRTVGDDDFGRLFCIVFLR